MYWLGYKTTLPQLYGHACGQLGDQGALVTTECPPQDTFSTTLSQVTSEGYTNYWSHSKHTSEDGKLRLLIQTRPGQAGLSSSEGMRQAGASSAAVSPHAPGSQPRCQPRGARAALCGQLAPAQPPAVSTWMEQSPQACAALHAASNPAKSTSHHMSSKPASTAKASRGEPSLSPPARSSSDLRAPCAEQPWQPTVLLLLLSPRGAGGGGKHNAMRLGAQQPGPLKGRASPGTERDSHWPVCRDCHQVGSKSTKCVLANCVWVRPAAPPVAGSPYPGLMPRASEVRVTETRQAHSIPGRESLRQVKLAGGPAEKQPRGSQE
ncbi:unnamed protein product, partial [Rangifer tarandus platyrhynchus]